MGEHRIEGVFRSVHLMWVAMPKILIRMIRYTFVSDNNQAIFHNNIKGNRASRVVKLIQNQILKMSL